MFQILAAVGDPVGLNLFEPRYVTMCKRIKQGVAESKFLFVPNFEDYRCRPGDTAFVINVDQVQDRGGQYGLHGRCECSVIVETTWIEPNTAGLHYASFKDCLGAADGQIVSPPDINATLPVLFKQGTGFYSPSSSVAQSSGSTPLMLAFQAPQHQSLALQDICSPASMLISTNLARRGQCRLLLRGGGVQLEGMQQMLNANVPQLASKVMEIGRSPAATSLFAVLQLLQRVAAEDPTANDVDLVALQRLSGSSARMTRAGSYYRSFFAQLRCAALFTEQSRPVPMQVADLPSAALSISRQRTLSLVRESFPGRVRDGSDEFNGGYPQDVTTAADEAHLIVEVSNHASTFRSSKTSTGGKGGEGGLSGGGVGARVGNVRFFCPLLEVYVRRQSALAALARLSLETQWHRLRLLLLAEREGHSILGGVTLPRIVSYMLFTPKALERRNCSSFAFPAAWQEFKLTSPTSGPTAHIREREAKLAMKKHRLFWTGSDSLFGRDVLNPSGSGSGSALVGAGSVASAAGHNPNARAFPEPGSEELGLQSSSMAPAPAGPASPGRQSEV
jgi:hypothetical protein